MNKLPCDGCGLPASPEHIAERLRRLELSTRYRPVHIGVLFVAKSPAVNIEDDFYGPAESREFSGPFLETLRIGSPAQNSEPGPSDLGPETHAADSARLVEFQRRGYYLTYLSECPMGNDVESPGGMIARLAPTLIRRIRFNYRSKFIAPIGQELSTLIGLLNDAGLGSRMLLPQGRVLPIPRAGDEEAMELIRRAVAGAAHSENLVPGYDRIHPTYRERDFGAGGGT